MPVRGDPWRPERGTSASGVAPLPAALPPVYSALTDNRFAAAHLLPSLTTWFAEMASAGTHASEWCGRGMKLRRKGLVEQGRVRACRGAVLPPSTVDLCSHSHTHSHTQTLVS